MPVNIPTQQLLSDGMRWFAYSGSVVGDISVPATISLITIENTGLRDSLIYIQPFYAQPVSTAGAQSLGQIVNIDDIEVFKSQDQENKYLSGPTNKICLMIPRQSKLEVLSLNTSGNNTQERGCNIIGYYL